jgi:hypothetical protein
MLKSNQKIIIKKTPFLVIGVMLLSAACSIEKQYTMRQKHKVYSFEQVNFNDLLKAYLNKTVQEEASFEGIYAVSLLTTKKGRTFLLNSDRERVTDRRDNFKQVAIIKDVKNLHREFIELTIDQGLFPSYSIKGEFSQFTENSFAVYKQLDKRDQFTTYTFSFDKSYDILEAVRIENSGNSVITYKLTYVKLFPKR